jgi:hypothetical protein
MKVNDIKVVLKSMKMSIGKKSKEEQIGRVQAEIRKRLRDFLGTAGEFVGETEQKEEVKQEAPAGAPPPSPLEAELSQEHFYAEESRAAMKLSLDDCLQSHDPGLPNIWIVCNMLNYELVEFYPLPFNDWGHDKLRSFVNSLGLDQLATEIEKHYIVGSTFLTTLTADAIMLRHHGNLRILAQFHLFAFAVTQSNHTIAIKLPKKSEVPADPVEMKANNKAPSPVTITYVADNIDGEHYHYTHLMAVLSRLNYDHLSDQETPRDFTATSHEEDKPDGIDEIIVNIGLVAAMVRILCKNIPAWTPLKFPPSRHILYEAMQRRTKVLFSKLITENENDGKGLHKICTFIHQHASPLTVNVEIKVAEGTASGGAAAEAAVKQVTTASGTNTQGPTLVPPAAATAASTPATLPTNVLITILIGVLVVFGDQLTRNRFFQAQFQSDEQFRFHCIRNFYAWWHALRVWDLKTWEPLYLKEQTDEPGTFPYYTNQIGMLRSVPTKEKHYDRLREHFTALGDMEMVALFQFVMAMDTTRSDLAFGFRRTFLSKIPFM